MLATQVILMRMGVTVTTAKFIPSFDHDVHIRVPWLIRNTQLLSHELTRAKLEPQAASTAPFVSSRAVTSLVMAQVGRSLRRHLISFILRHFALFSKVFRKTPCRLFEIP